MAQDRDQVKVFADIQLPRRLDRHYRRIVIRLPRLCRAIQAGIFLEVTVLRQITHRCRVAEQQRTVAAHRLAERDREALCPFNGALLCQPPAVATVPVCSDLEPRRAFGGAPGVDIVCGERCHLGPGAAARFIVQLCPRHRQHALVQGLLARDEQWLIGGVGRYPCERTKGDGQCHQGRNESVHGHCHKSEMRCARASPPAANFSTRACRSASRSRALVSPCCTAIWYHLCAWV